MKKILILALLALAGNIFAQAPTYTPTRIYIRHADPELIIRLLSGKLDVRAMPEYSTIRNQFGGWGGGRR